eukprot:scaffold13341_cov101-Isochrysis_galbana.AAC.12
MQLGGSSPLPFGILLNRSCFDLLLGQLDGLVREPRREPTSRDPDTPPVQPPRPPVRRKEHSGAHCPPGTIICIRVHKHGATRCNVHLSPPLGIPKAPPTDSRVAAAALAPVAALVAVRRQKLAHPRSV